MRYSKLDVFKFSPLISLFIDGITENYCESWEAICNPLLLYWDIRNGGGRVVSLLTWWARDPGFKPGSRQLDFIGKISSSYKLWCDWNIVKDNLNCYWISFFVVWVFFYFLIFFMKSLVVGWGFGGFFFCYFCLRLLWCFGFIPEWTTMWVVYYTPLANNQLDTKKY